MQNLQFAAIDVDDKSFHLAITDAISGKIIDFKCRPEASAIMSRLEKHRLPNTKLKVCYEATHLGFSLCRKLRDKGFDCEVIAPSLIPDVPGRAQKTNRLDARQMADFYMKGLLTAVHVPGFDDEMDRGLVRSRKFMVEQQTATKNHITGLLKRLGWDFKQEEGAKAYWTKKHLDWLSAKIKSVENPRLKINLRLLLEQFKQIAQTIAQYDTEIDNMADEDAYKKKVKALVCYRGIAVSTAMTFITEIGDIRRFGDDPRRLTSYCGMDIREYSSGKEQRFGISKLGNRHIRTAAIEACQFAFRPIKMSRALKLRRQDAAPEMIDIADRCMSRLYKKGNRLLHKGKHRNVAKTACARELLMFLWESLMKVA